MQYKKLITAEIEFTKTFKLIAQAYEEIAVMKMRKVRKSVLATREYLGKLSKVFIDVKKAYERQKQEESLKEKFRARKKEVSDDKKLEKTVSVFLSANTTLYGDLIAKIFKLFQEKTSQDGSDLIIIGRVGRRLYEEQEKKRPYLYFELPDIEISLDHLKPVMFHLVKYQKIMVYYGRFENIVNQTATISNVTGDQPFSQTAEAKAKVEEGLGMQFLFEPSLETIMDFFQELIASSLFRQTVHETQLARLASRIMSMEKAQTNIEQNIKKLNFLQIKIDRQEQNKKQLERLAGLPLW